MGFWARRSAKRRKVLSREGDSYASASASASASVSASLPLPAVEDGGRSSISIMRADDVDGGKLGASRVSKSASRW